MAARTPGPRLRLQRCRGVLLFEQLPLKAVRAVDAVPVATRLDAVPVGRRPDIALKPAVRRHLLRYDEACRQLQDSSASGENALQ